MGLALAIGYRAGVDAALRRRGCDVLTAALKLKSGMSSADTEVVVDLESPQEILRAVQRRGRPVRTVVTGHEQGVFPAAVLRCALDLPGDRDIARTLAFRDKHLQKSLLGDVVRHARSMPLTASTSYRDIVTKLGLPFVIKPAAGYGAIGTSVISNEDGFHTVLAGIDLRTSIATIVEEHVDGPEFHVDGVWVDGVLRWYSVGRYLDPPGSYHDGGVFADLILSRANYSGLYADAEQLTTKVLIQLDAPSCVFHLEGFIVDHELIFGEVAARPAGAHVTEIIHATYGVDLLDAQVALALGQEPDTPQPVDQQALLHGYVYLRRFPGASLTDADYVGSFGGIVTIDFRANHPSVGAYGRGGVAIVRSTDETRLVAEMTAIVAMNKADHG